MDLMWAQGQNNMPLKCIGISEEHVNDADCSGDFSMHFWCPFLWTRVCVVVCVSLHVTNDNGMYSIRRGHFIQNVTPIPSTHREARALEMPAVHRKVDLWFEAKMSWETSFLLHDAELLTLCRRQTLPTPRLSWPWNDKRTHLDPVGPGALLHLTAVATETGSKQDSWEKTSLYYFL